MSHRTTYPFTVFCPANCGGEYSYRVNGRDRGRYSIEFKGGDGCSCSKKPWVNEEAYYQELEELAENDYMTPPEDR